MSFRSETLWADTTVNGSIGTRGTASVPEEPSTDMPAYQVPARNAGGGRQAAHAWAGVRKGRGGEGAAERARRAERYRSAL